MRGYILIALAAMLWGTTGTSQALAPAGFTPLSVGALRILLGGAVLLAVALLRGKFRQRSHWEFWMVVLAAVTIALYQLAFFAGTKITGVAVGTMVGIGSAPIFAGIIDVLWMKRGLTRNWWIATLLAITGIIVLVGGGGVNLRLDPLGVLFALTAGLSYVLYAAAVQRLTQAHSPEEVVAVVFSLGALLLLPLLLASDLSPVFTPRGGLVVLHLGVLATGLSYTLFGFGMQTTPVATAATLTLMEPLTAAVLSVLVLREELGLQRLIGMALIVLGLIVLALRPGGGKEPQGKM